jgi:hypothetical protein
MEKGSAMGTHGLKVGKIEKQEWGKSHWAQAENIRQPDGEAETICSQERKEAQRPGGLL